MRLKIQYQGRVYDATVVGDHKVLINNYDISLYQQEGNAKIDIYLDQCKHCGEWMSIEDGLYGDGYCDKCASMCLECDQYHNAAEMIKDEEELICKECHKQFGIDLWKELGDVPIDEDECLDLRWRHFDKGTPRTDVWHWFEKTYNVSVGKDLMYR
jgi:hypothetical protein